MAAADREIAAEDSIRVVCRFRPLNDSEEKAGSKFVVKFPQGQEENCISIGVSYKASAESFHRFFPWQENFPEEEKNLFRLSHNIVSSLWFFYCLCYREVSLKETSEKLIRIIVACDSKKKSKDLRIKVKQKNQ